MEVSRRRLPEFLLTMLDSSRLELDMEASKLHANDLTCLHLTAKFDSSKKALSQAGNAIRTRDIHLGKVTLYH
jgi:hypothetical protein